MIRLSNSLDSSIDWLAARDAIDRTQRAHDNDRAPPRILIINGSLRGEHTCPGDMVQDKATGQARRTGLHRDGICR